MLQKLHLKTTYPLRLWSHQRFTVPTGLIRKKKFLVTPNYKDFDSVLFLLYGGFSCVRQAHDYQTTQKGQDFREQL